MTLFNINYISKAYNTLKPCQAKPLKPPTCLFTFYAKSSHKRQAIFPDRSTISTLLLYLKLSRDSITLKRRTPEKSSVKTYILLSLKVTSYLLTSSRGDISPSRFPFPLKEFRLPGISWHFELKKIFCACQCVFGNPILSGVCYSCYSQYYSFSLNLLLSSFELIFLL